MDMDRAAIIAAAALRAQADDLEHGDAELRQQANTIERMVILPSNRLKAVRRQLCLVLLILAGFRSSDRRQES